MDLSSSGKFKCRLEIVCKTDLLLWSVLDYCLLQKRVGDLLTGMVSLGEDRSRYLRSRQPAA